MKKWRELWCGLYFVVMAWWPVISWVSPDRLPMSWEGSSFGGYMSMLLGLVLLAHSWMVMTWLFSLGRSKR